MTTANAAERPATPRAGLLAQHPLVFYFLLAYAGTWLVTVPLALSANNVGLLPFGFPDGSVFFISALWIFVGPTLAAFIMTGVTEGGASIRRLLSRYVLWRVGLRWYLVALFGPPAIMLLVTILLPGALASFRTLAPLNPLVLLVSFPLILIFGGALSRKEDGGGSRCRACGSCTGRWSGASSSGHSGRVGTCPCSRSRFGVRLPPSSTWFCISPPWFS
jgi:hypothetical protein